MTATNKRLHISETRDNSSQCTPCKGKLKQHTTYASYSSTCTPGIRFLWAVPVRDNLSLALTKSKQPPTPERSLDKQRQTDPVVILGRQLLQLTGPRSPACDWYVQYLLTGLTHRSLTDIDGDYNIGCASLTHTTPQPSQPAVSTFS
jgi:hypothetical protein